MELEKPISLPSEEEPPEYLYHYTSIEGLAGILTKRSLWAAQIYFLNDTQELSYSDGVLKKVCDELLREYPIQPMPAAGSAPGPPDPKALLARFYSYTGSINFNDYYGLFPIFVFSLSAAEEGDLLSQWRAYCPPMGGYSIGFRSDFLIKLLRTTLPKFFLQRCIYEEREQEANVKRMVMEKGDAFLKGMTGDPAQDYNNCRNSFMWDFLRQTAAALKHPSFQEEYEWRIVSERIGIQHVLFRIKKSTLIPYFAITFKQFDPFPIDEIIIGPGPQQILARVSLGQLLLQNNLSHIEIRTSKIPYREIVNREPQIDDAVSFLSINNP